MPSQTLKENLSDGADSLTKVKDASGQVIATTSRSGQGRIKQEVQLLTQDYEDFRTQVNAAHLSLETCLSRYCVGPLTGEL